VSGGDCLLYVPSGDIAAFADAVERLIDDPGLRVELGERGRRRVADVLDWRPQAEAYVGVFDELTGFSRPGPAVPDDGVISGADRQGRRYVDLDDRGEARRYLLERRAPRPRGRERAPMTSSSSNDVGAPSTVPAGTRSRHETVPRCA
jgi:hypothetical protein